ncbi:MAG TPA: zinc ribbon domain-containing protein [bacterium]|nr:zinc ribbon domain-containing protein [bacterium]
MKKIIIIIFVLFITNFDLYAYHFNFDYKNIGTRASALGGAYTSVIDQTNYNFINPAAINFNNNLNINLTYRFPSDVKILPANFNVDMKKENEIEFFNLNYTLKKFNVGYLYSNKYNWKYEDKFEKLIITNFTFTPNPAIINFKSTQSVNKQSLPISYKCSDNLYLGIELSLFKIEEKNLYDTTSVLSQIKNDKIYSFGLGVLYKLNTNTNLGLSFFNKIFIDNYWSMMGNFEQPLNINFGISHIFEINDKINLLVSSDISYEKWKYRNRQMKTVETPNGSYGGVIYSYDKINRMNFKVGSEFRILNNFFAHNFRLGFYTKKSPDNIYWDEVKENLIQATIGYGIEINLNNYNNIFFDMSYEDTLNKAQNKEEIIKFSLAYNHKLEKSKKEKSIFKPLIQNEDKKEQIPNIKKELSNSEKINEKLIEESKPEIIDRSDFIYCHNCGFKLLINSRFCSRCGAKIIE